MAVISFALHIVCIVAMVAVTALQVPLKNLLHFSHHHGGATFVMPSVVYIAGVVAIFLWHACLTWAFMSTMGRENIHVGKMKAYSVLSIIFVVIIQPIKDTLSRRLDIFMHSRLGTDHFTEAIVTINFLSNVLLIRFIALSLLLVVAGMAFYFCHLRGVRANSLQD